MKHLEEGLKILGFNEKEIKIFLALLVKKSATPTQISGMVKIPRTTINPILRKLEKRKIVNRIKLKNHWEWKATEFTEIKESLNKAIKIFE